MKAGIRQTWVSSLALIIKKPVVLLPFMVFAFLEGLALEVIYFSPRPPISHAVNPIIKKFFGETFLHYPANLFLLPQLSYYVQIVLYVLIGVFLSAISINIFKNIKSKLPLKGNAIAKNAFRRYPAYFSFGLLIILLIFALKTIDVLILSRCFRWASNYAPNFTARVAPFATPVFLFFTNTVMQTFFIMTLPILVLEKRAFPRALAGSIYLGGRYFFGIFTLILVPFLIYFPISLLNHFSKRLVTLTFPEITVCTAALGIIVSIFIDCFVLVCASQYLLDRQK